MKDELSAAEVDGWDSLTHMIIITEIEKKFQISFKLKELNKLSNLGSLINLIQLKTS
jgi:acyl carrier protein